jgi:hypothetical protein
MYLPHTELLKLARQGKLSTNSIYHTDNGIYIATNKKSVRLYSLCVTNHSINSITGLQELLDILTSRLDVKIHVGPTPMNNPEINDLWFDTSE